MLVRVMWESESCVTKKLAAALACYEKAEKAIICYEKAGWHSRVTKKLRADHVLRKSWLALACYEKAELDDRHTNKPKLGLGTTQKRGSPERLL